MGLWNQVHIGFFDRVTAESKLRTYKHTNYVETRLRPVHDQHPRFFRYRGAWYDCLWNYYYYTLSLERCLSSSPGGYESMRSVCARFLREILESAHAQEALRTRHWTRWRRPAPAFGKVSMTMHEHRL